jgi:hypothetical protein
MASPPSVRRALKRLVENSKASCKARLLALARLQRLGVPTALLERLMRGPALPPRLLVAVLDVYDAKQTIRESRQRQKKAETSSVLGSK